uniref:SLC26A/SulP transporter domain-containing protein n=1 Tax=Panagrolaimus superbus TaxID=310955 RepID=A0A914YXR8_9BILA
MSEDAHGGPEVFSDDDSNAPYSVYASRPPMNQEEFDARFGYSKPIHHHPTLIRKSAKFSRRYYRPFTSFSAFFNTIFGFIPILQWLPKYNWKENLTMDIIGGLTVGVMHVPQGIAYALLANVQPVVGLYTSFFPPLFYMIFGTSRHNSIGSFAVVALMSGMAVSKACGEPAAPFNGSMGEDPTTYDACALGTASTLAFCVGIIHLVMAVLRLEIITTYFSDQLVAGFTTAASFHVFVTQLKDLFGLRGVKKAEGPGHLFRTLWTYVSNYDKINPVTCIMGFCAMAFLIIGKDFVNPFLKKRFRLATPLPFELMVVVFGTLISGIFHLNPNFNVKIVEKIPTGLPTPHIPKISEMPELFFDALSIAVVVVAVHISLAKMFAKKLRYKVDPGQELYALGLSSSLSAFFPVYPVSCSLGRTLVNVEAGTKTQLSTIASTIFLAAIIGYIGKWLETLPMCVLSAIVIVALKGMVKKFADLPHLWPVSKIDCSIWVVSFVATVAWDVTPGLGISIIWALMTTVFRTQFPRWHFLATLTGTNDFRDSERYKAVVDHNYATLTNILKQN